MRPIDAEKYMELLKEQYLHHKSMGNSQAAKAWQGAMQLLYDMTTLTPPNEWVSVEERLPENNADVLCWYEYFRYGNYNRMYQTYGIGYCVNGYWGGEVSNGTQCKVLFEMGKIEKPDDRLAMEFCKTSKMGEYKCAVKNRFGFFCDLCIEDEILHLRSLGIHTVASCCGHGEKELASILMDMGYKLLDCLYGRENWEPKSIMLYEKPEGEEDINV